MVILFLLAHEERWADENNFAPGAVIEQLEDESEDERY
mgnify:FL=1